MVKSGFVDCDYYVNETMARLKSGRYFQKRCKPGYLVTGKVPKTHTHTHKYIEIWNSSVLISIYIQESIKFIFVIFKLNNVAVDIEF